MKCRHLLALSVSILVLTNFTTLVFAQVNKQAAEKIDAYIDLRFDADESATENLLSELKQLGLATPEQLEAALRGKRADYPDPAEWIGTNTTFNVDCYHVDYSSRFLMFVPKDFSGDRAVPLVIVGHGGNSSMSQARAYQTAKVYLSAYAPAMSNNLGAIVVAPVSGRGWGQIGNSLILSTVSKVQRMLPVDPDKIYIAGQSMGGHLAFRSAISLPDRFGAVSPNSGGYDYVEKKAVGNLINVPGYAIWGKREPYGINTDNRTNAKWAESDWAVENKLNWKFVEKNGGHTIYGDELPAVADFFAENPRNPYRESVYLRAGGMKFVKTWQIKGWPEHVVHSETRPLRWNMRHWLQVEPREGEVLTAHARYLGDNRFEIASENVRDLSVFLHPNMIDFDKPVVVSVNGKVKFDGKVAVDPSLMFELAKEFDDRGRIFHAKIDLSVDTDQEIVVVPGSE